MTVVQMHDKADILSFLMKNPELQLYAIGDLDDFFWPHTFCYGLYNNGEILAIALLYSGMEIPTLLAFYDGDPSHTRTLLEQIKTHLPPEYYAHLSPGLLDSIGKGGIQEYNGLHYKMILQQSPAIIDDDHIRRLSLKDISRIEELFAKSYPENWFDKRMLQTGKYFGYFDHENLAGIAGIHVYSRKYRVAALGNIATHPEYRRRQIGFKLTSALCHDLRQSVDYIGLNVKCDNKAAVDCYMKAGFVVAGRYIECHMNNNQINKSL